MNPPEAPEAIVNGQTTPIVPQSSAALKTKAKPKKAPEIPLLENRNWLLHLHYVRKEFGICRKLIQEELEKSRGMCEYANYLQGLILRHEGKIQESLEYFQICHVLNPKSVDNIKQVARSLFLLGRHRLAVEAYLQAESIATKPDWEIYHNLGVCLMYVKEYAKAKEYLQQAIQLNHHDRSFIMLSKIYIMENDIQSAIDVYNKALEFSPDNSELATTLGLLYMQTGQHQKAFEKLGSALAHDATYTRALIAAGSMMQGHQDYDVALAKYRVASQYIPESSALWNNIGMCFFGKKKYVAAISCLKRANYLAPLDWKVLYNLGLVHLTMQQYASAFHFLSASINLRPNRGQTFMLLAITLKHLEDPENAKHAYDQAVHLDNKDPSIPLNYAIFLYSQGDSIGAAKHLAQFDQRITKLRQSSTFEIDQELLDVGSKLNSTLNLQGGKSSRSNLNRKGDSSRRDMNGEHRRKHSKKKSTEQTPTEEKSGEETKNAQENLQPKEQSEDEPVQGPSAMASDEV